MFPNHPRESAHNHNLQNDQRIVPSAEVIKTYVKGLLRLHRFVYLTGTAGATMDLNGHAAAGIRFSLPIAPGLHQEDQPGKVSA
jgi:hypothetical protein